jgi:mRNA guanylyltransferase
MGGSVPTIPGVKAEGHLLHSFQREVANLLGRSSQGFPGAQPVSFAARHKLELQKQDYYVCEKSDGIRCLMYMTSDGPREVVYLIDRKNDYYYVPNLHFPLSSEDNTEFHTGTLVDGELVNDVQPNGTHQLTYLVFDCLMLDGSSLMHRTLDKRLAYFRDKVYNPYRALYKTYPEEIQYLPFIVDFKDMKLGYGIEMMFREILPNLSHGSDGLIFTCRNSPYQFGTDPHILKWKSEDENSIDFRLNFEWPMLEPDVGDEDQSPFPDYEVMPKCHLSVHKGKGVDERYGVMFLEDHEWESMKAQNQPLDDRIVECRLDAQGRWRFLRWRDDKKEANHISTVESVMESIKDRVSKEDLIRLSFNIKQEWKKRQAAEEARAKQEMEARKALSVEGALNSQDGAPRMVNSTIKRKAEEEDYASTDHERKKRLTP